MNRYTIPITLFNEFGDACETKLDESSNETVVMILAAAKISSYDGLCIIIFYAFCKSTYFIGFPFMIFILN